MIKFLVALALAAAATTPPAADDKTDVMATINQFVDGFNKGDTRATAACADQTARRVSAARMARGRRLPRVDEGL